MTASNRNVMVGAFVLVALGLLGWMIVRFGAQPRLLQRTYKLTMTFPTVGTVTEDSEVKVRGVTVGYVKTIEGIDNYRRGVRVVAEINNDQSIPADSQATITIGGVGLAKPFINIVVRQGAGPAMLPKDGSATLPGVVAMETIIPPETQAKLDELTTTLTIVAGDMHMLLVPLNEFGQPLAATQPETNISVSVRRLNALLGRLNELLDPKAGDVGAALARLPEIAGALEEFSRKAVVVADSANHTFNAATTQVDEIGRTATAQLRRVGDALAANSIQLSRSLETLDQVMNDVRAGRGTLGKLVTDPTLFENMVLSADRLHQAIIELQRLLEQWRAEGLKVKL